MNPAEEPVTPPADVETPPEVVTPPADTNAAPPATGAEVVEPAPADAPDLMALLTAEFGEDPANDAAAAEAVKAITAEDIKNAPAPLRVALRALMKQQADDAAKRTQAADERIKAAEAREAAAIAAEKRAAQLRAAALKAAGTAKDPGAPPKVDLLTEEGIQKHLDSLAKKAQWEATAPARAEHAEISQNQSWLDLCEKYPLLKDEKIGGEGGEFDVFFGEFAKSFDLTKMGPEQRTALVTHAARLFTAEKNQAVVAEQVRRDAAAKQRAQAASAQAIGRSSGSGGPDPLAYIKQLERAGDTKALYDYLASNPKARAAYEASLS